MCKIMCWTELSYNALRQWSNSAPSHKVQNTAIPASPGQDLWSAIKWFAFGISRFAEAEREDNNDTEQFSHQQRQLSHPGSLEFNIFTIFTSSLNTKSGKRKNKKWYFLFVTHKTRIWLRKSFRGLDDSGFFFFAVKNSQVVLKLALNKRALQAGHTLPKKKNCWPLTDHVSSLT